MDRPQPPQTSLAAQWKRSQQLAALGNKLGPRFTDWDIADDLEANVLLRPIATMEDAIAKLGAIQLAFVDGARSDGADAKALCQTILWLHAQCVAEQSDERRVA